ncbi:MAG: GNAT family N-acetyltransferase [Candidatus Hodarchaeales archaeon]|jgi:predicted GNAT family acetyltransferase
MEITFYSNVDEFYDICFPFLLAYEAENNLLFGLLNRLKNNIYTFSNNEKPFFLTISVKGKIKLVSLRTPPHNQLISYTEDLDTIPFLVKRLLQEQMEIPGIFGFKEGALKFAQLWGEKTNKKFQLELNERCYRLERVNPTTVGPHLFEQGTIIDKELLLQWMKAFILEAIPNPSVEEIENSQKRFEHSINQNMVYVLKVGENIVSMVKKAGITPNGQTINGVYTPPALRNNGYATEVVAKLSQTILDEGKKFCFLFTNLANPTSNKIYLNIGYNPIADLDVYKFIGE